MPPSEVIALGPDPAVWQREALLDPAGMGERLGACLGAEVDGCERAWLNYSAGRRVRVVHRLTAGGATYDVTSATFPSAGASAREQAQALERARPVGALPGVAHDRELATVHWVLPNERRISGLRALLAPPGSELLAYGPERAATARWVRGDGATLAYAKAYGHEPAERIAGLHDTLGAAVGPGAPLRLPRVLRYDAADRILVLEPMAGRPVGPVEAELRALGAAVATLHGLPAPPVPLPERHDVLRAARLLAVARPDAGARADELAGELHDRRAEGATEPVCVHGDLMLGNGLLGDDGVVGLLDLDQVACGPAGADLGRVLAYLRYRRLLGRLGASEEAALGAALLDGYRAVRALPDAAALRWHTAASLLTWRALGATIWLRARELERLEAILDDAAACLHGPRLEVAA